MGSEARYALDVLNEAIGLGAPVAILSGQVPGVVVQPERFGSCHDPTVVSPGRLCGRTGPYSGYTGERPERCSDQAMGVPDQGV